MCFPLKDMSYWPPWGNCTIDIDSWYIATMQSLEELGLQYLDYKDQKLLGCQ